MKYQVFDVMVSMDSKDAERLKVYLSGWNKLHAMFFLGVNESDLRRLVILELMGACRSTMITRLLGRLAKLERQKILGRIAQLAV